MIVLKNREPVLVDREALAMLTDRSLATIRAHAEVVGYRNGRALYNLDTEVSRLESIPRRARPAR